MSTSLRVRALLTSALTVAASALSLASAAPASAAVTFGIGDSRTDMFTDAKWKALPLKDVRNVVEWDTPQMPAKVAKLDAWMAAAQAAGARPLLAIEHSWTPGKEKTKPSIAQYTALITWLKSRYPTWKTLTPWNEANYYAQPTAKNPKLAYDYWVAAKRACPGCTVLSPAFLAGVPGADKWLRTFKAVSHGKVKLWALHAYGDQNRMRDKLTVAFEKAVIGQIWITETAGWVKFLDTGAWPYDEDRAAKVIGYIFKSAKKHQARIKRWYFYQWRGAADPTVRWDSGVLNADGSERPGYAALAKGLGR